MNNPNDEHPLFIPVILGVVAVLIAVAVFIATYQTSSTPLRYGGIGSQTPPPGTTSLIVSGTIKYMVDAKSFVIDTEPQPGRATTTSMTVVVGSTTVITETKQKDPQAFQKEMADFQKQQSSAVAGTSTSPLPPPSPFILSTVSFGSLAPGMVVTVVALEPWQGDTIKADRITIAAQ